MLPLFSEGILCGGPWLDPMTFDFAVVHRSLCSPSLYKLRSVSIASFKCWVTKKKKLENEKNDTFSYLLLETGWVEESYDPKGSKTQVVKQIFINTDKAQHYFRTNCLCAMIRSFKASK